MKCESQLMRDRPHTIRSSARRGGFTLTEMLVATALVVLIMLMFAQIYGSAVGSIQDQRALANNDQKARTIESTIRKDLQTMTYRQPSYPYASVQGIVPMAQGDEPIIDHINQLGYFYYDENDQATDTDDILQFTVLLGRGQRGDVDDRGRPVRFIGKASNSLTADNDPELDDGIADNGQGSSSAAEIAYFLRGGNLYRRVLLIREPLAQSLDVDSQPTNGVLARRIFRRQSTMDYGGVNYYRDYDFAATRRLFDAGGGGSVLWFHSIESLANDRGFTNVPLARPRNRFGFSHSSGSARDFVNGRFIGRFTLQECTHSDFLWPGQDPAAADDPYDRTDLNDSDSNSVVDTYQDEINSSNSRVSEDILLTNVESFDVKAFDWASQSLVDASTVFDTWHPSLGSAAPTVQYLVSAPGTWAANSSSLTTIAIPALNQSSSNQSLVYRKISDGGTTGTIQPEFPPVVGSIVRDNTVVWECVDNRIPLQAIRISIRFRDTRSNQPRQVTIVHSFVE